MNPKTKVMIYTTITIRMESMETATNLLQKPAYSTAVVVSTLPPLAYCGNTAYAIPMNSPTTRRKVETAITRGIILVILLQPIPTR